VIETPYRDIRGRPQKSSFRTKIQRAIAVLQVARMSRFLKGGCERGCSEASEHDADG
jgi:hypothetical protein